MSNPERITLEDGERALIKRLPRKTGFVGIVHFSGPRGGKYRPIRTQACLNEELAIEAVADIRSRRYARGAFPTTERICEVDFIGRVVASA